MIKVLVAGFMGSMGQKTVEMINQTGNFQLVAGLGPNSQGIDRTEYHLNEDVKIFEQLSEVETDADVWVDFTVPTSAYENVKFAIEHGIHPVVGTSGVPDNQVAELITLAAEKQVGGLIAPNFGLSAVLLMKFAQEAARYFPDAEVIEMHHEDKLDAPSGTAISTAKMIAAARGVDPVTPATNETVAGARGSDVAGVPVHAVRLPGYVAHEQVLFGGPGEALTLRQDSFDRSSFMSGVKLAIPAVIDAKTLMIGLENIL
ncbi:4-hydroxy-tetrahydrodipicolinate reductase [Lentilactobacillus kosonis]|uniref:4-hydroxy-tetrahydrodipicolinate reductase n=1 Tax=Lentilactobacillus kosonis TaxID=2810561 RepID=A0A401FMA1_9LACO|nr:4-hydroxy-tetrahydrodipicolinate reductase [Lentilactobacillus kosonis]GAY73504.1 4-hydroxy-tetrahydrodipicolinate reductase [Lentilactobacillus kosonis]